MKWVMMKSAVSGRLGVARRRYKHNLYKNVLWELTFKSGNSTSIDILQLALIAFEAVDEMASPWHNK